MVTAGKLGAKSGEGFYVYTKGSKELVVSTRNTLPVRYWSIMSDSRQVGCEVRENNGFYVYTRIQMGCRCFIAMGDSSINPRPRGVGCFSSLSVKASFGRRVIKSPRRANELVLENGVLNVTDTPFANSTVQMKLLIRFRVSKNCSREIMAFNFYHEDTKVSRSMSKEMQGLTHQNLQNLFPGSFIEVEDYKVVVHHWIDSFGKGAPPKLRSQLLVEAELPSFSDPNSKCLLNSICRRFGRR